MNKPIRSDVTQPGLQPSSVADWRAALRSASPAALLSILVGVASWTKQNPQSADAQALLGDTYLKARQPYAAESTFRKALKIDPRHVQAREGLGLALLQIGKAAEASDCFGKAHTLDRHNAEILIHWGLALIQLGNLKAAHNRFLQALEREPENPHGWLNLGLVDTQRGSWSSAIGNFEKSTQYKPDFPVAWHNLALAYRHIGDLTQALGAAITLTKVDPSQAPHWSLLAELQLNAGHVELAELALQRALAVNPSDPSIYLTKAMLFSANRQYNDAEGVLTTALALTKDDPDIQLELGHLHLLQRRFETGWELHEARKRIALSPVRRFPLPDWDGEPLMGKTVVVHAEQGLGDTILFAHCLPDLIRSAGHVIVEVAPRLAPLFARSFPGATVIAREPKDIDLAWLHEQPHAIDYQIPIGSLPRHFRQSLGSFSPNEGYLHADPERVEYWRRRLAEFGHPVIGLAWRGGLVQTGREQRSLSLGELAPILRGAAVHWISLQYGNVAQSDVATAMNQGFALTHWPEVLVNQDEVAALTSALDSVVTVCSTQAHLTGALGRPGWVLTPFNANWRYGSEGEKMPWYPSLKLLRQSAAGDWSTPLSQLRSMLTADSKLIRST